MASLILPGAMSAIPGLIGLLMGNPQDQLRRRINRLLASQSSLTSRFYQENIGSPAYSQALGSIAAGANVAGGNLAQALAARGIGTSGSAAVLSSLIPSVVGGQQAGLRTSAFQSAQERAMAQIQQQIAMLMGTQGPSPAQMGFAGGLQAFAPFLQQYLAGKYPGIFGTTKPAAPSYGATVGVRAGW